MRIDDPEEPMRATAESRHDPGEDVRFLITQTSSNIANADTKADLLVAGLTVLLGGFAVQGKSLLREPWRQGWHYIANAVGLSLAAVFAITSALLLVHVLIPRTFRPAEATCFSWPWLEAQAIDDLMKMSDEILRREAWLEVAELAHIANKKYREDYSGQHYRSCETHLELQRSDVDQDR